LSHKAYNIQNSNCCVHFQEHYWLLLVRVIRHPHDALAQEILLNEVVEKLAKGGVGVRRELLAGDQFNNCMLLFLHL